MGFIIIVLVGEIVEALDFEGVVVAVVEVGGYSYEGVVGQEMVGFVGGFGYEQGSAGMLCFAMGLASGGECEGLVGIDAHEGFYVLE